MPRQATQSLLAQAFATTVEQVLAELKAAIGE